MPKLPKPKDLLTHATDALLGAAGAIPGAPLAWRWRWQHPDEMWDWSKIDLDDIRLPRDFLWGVANAAHQVEGGSEHNNWARFERQRGPDGGPTIAGDQRCGRACDHWNRFREDIELAHALGVRGFRLSLAWDKLEPEPGRFDEGALRHYHDVLDALHERGMEPMVTLHHFTHPLWFADMGSFERAENIDHFVRFSERVFREYADKVRLWCTINEPAVFATQGWFSGVFPPGKREPQLTAEVIANLIAAHARVYAALRALPRGDQARIGLVKNLFQFDPLRRHNALDWAVARILDRVFNGALLECLESGRFHIRVPGLITIDRQIPDAPGSMDFVGLNYYSRFHVRFRPDPREPFTMAQRDLDIQTDMPYPIYAEGLYRALTRLARLGLPIYVTENGIADARDDRRALYIRRYLHALSRAVAEGVDVRGYFYWTLMDNFEWAEGYDMKFGLYAMDPDTLERTLRPGARALMDIVAAHRAAHADE